MARVSLLKFGNLLREGRIGNEGHVDKTKGRFLEGFYI